MSTARSIPTKLGRTSTSAASPVSFRNALVNHWAPNNSHPSPPQSETGEWAERHRRQVCLQLSQAAGVRRVASRRSSWQRSNPGGQDYGESMILNRCPQNPSTRSDGQFERWRWWRPAGWPAAAGHEAAMKSRLHEKTFITHRVGENVRVAVSDKEAIVMYGKSGENTVFCDQEGCHSTKPLTIKKPQSQNSTTTSAARSHHAAHPTPGGVGPRRPPPNPSDDGGRPS